MKLVITGGQFGRYVALSHCWGAAHMLRTTSTTLGNRLAGIPFSSLPLTFKDAAPFTRCLGYRYPWIDLLCIVQDDPLDWEKESAAMYEVYGNAAVTISATSSKDSEAGLSSGRKIQPMEIGRLYKVDDAREDLYLRYKHPRRYWKSRLYDRSGSNH